MKIPSYRIALIREGEINYTVSGINDAIEIASKILPSNLDREQFWVLLLDTKHNVVGANCVSIGTIDASLVHPREVFKAAILANCSAIILAHNHPSGNVAPSPEDKEITMRLVSAGKILGIRVLDHIIVGDETFSFSANEMI